MSGCQDESRFRERYERHVGYVVAGDTRAALADMLPGVVPAVYDGVTVPRGATGRSIVAVFKKDDKWYGETVYDTPTGPIGLRSIWWLHDGEWLAAELENFPV
jgi:hypothetical protein